MLASSESCPDIHRRNTIYFSTNVNEITRRILTDKINSIRREIEQWKRRNLTPIGNICIIKALLLSKLVHLFMTLPKPSKQDITQIETLLYKFIWNNKGDKSNAQNWYKNMNTTD